MIRAQKRRARIRRTALVFLFLAFLLLAGALYAPRIDALVISRTSVSGVRILSERDVEDVAAREMDGAYALLFPKNISLWYPKENVLRAILSLPAVRDASVRVSDNTLHISVRERSPAYVWCNERPDFSLSGLHACLFVDEEDIAFARAPSFSRPLFFTVFPGEGVETSIAPGEHVLPAGVFEKAALIASFLSSLGADVRMMEILPDGDYALLSPWGTRILFSGDADAAATVETLRIGLGGEGITNPDVYEYIDARFEGKLFLKKRESAGEKTTAGKGAE